MERDILEKSWNNASAVSKAFRSEVKQFIRKRWRQIPGDGAVPDEFKLQFAQSLKEILTKWADPAWQTTEMKKIWAAEIAWIDSYAFPEIFKRTEAVWTLD